MGVFRIKEKVGSAPSTVIGTNILHMRSKTGGRLACFPWARCPAAGGAGTEMGIVVSVGLSFVVTRGWWGRAGRCYFRRGFAPRTLVLSPLLPTCCLVSLRVHGLCMCLRGRLGSVHVLLVNLLFVDDLLSLRTRPGRRVHTA